VAKSRRAPALFEVIEQKQLQGSSSKLVLPKWWRGNKGATPNYPPVEAPEEKPAEVGKIIKLTPPVTKPVAQQSPSTVAPPRTTPATASVSPDTSVSRPAAGNGTTSVQAPTSPGGGPPVVRVGGGRLQLSLNPTSVALIVVVVLLAFWVSYRVGTHFAGAGPMKDDTADLLKDPTKPSALNPSPAEFGPGRKTDSSRRETRSEGSGSSKERSGARTAAGSPTGASVPPAPPGKERTTPSKPPVVPPVEPPGVTELKPAPEPAPVAAGRKSGLTYVVLATLKAEDREEAVQAQKWLAAKNVNVTIEEKQRGGRLELVSADGFDYGNAAEKAKYNELLSRVKNLSQGYKNEFKGKARYDFSQPYPVKWKD
jgi:hypothetical protein